MPKRRSSKPEDVSADETTKRESPNVPTLEQLKQSARQAGSDDGRAEVAKPFPLTTLGYEVLVAPIAGDEWYDELFEVGRRFFEGGDGEINVDRAFIKGVVLNCVVEPKLDDEALDLIIKYNTAEFAALANFCMTMTLAETPLKIADRLGALDTEAQELYFAGARGSSSMQMPV